jgi:guanosine-3',5'-bis(diphosphate) 3'-pyrophosphohydrolase
MSKLIQKATEIMIIAHGDQTRKTDGSPYNNHPQAVADILKENSFSDTVIAAGLCHDVLEDTDYSPEKLKEELGQEVFELVSALSENESLEWEERKEKYVEQIKNSSEGAKAISICDKIHNLSSLIDGHAKMGPEVWNKFNRGKEKKMWFENKMLEMFQVNWSHPLIAKYETLLNQAKQLD